MAESSRESTPLAGRITVLETRFTQFEQQVAQVQSSLNKLLEGQTHASQSSDDRVDKLVSDKLESIKDQQREYKTKIEGLESGKRFNLVGTAVVVAAAFGVFTYFSGQSADSTRQLITSESNLQKLQFSNLLSGLTADMAPLKTAATKQALDEEDYQQFKGLVTQQNTISIQQRADAAEAIKMLTASLAELSTKTNSWISESKQKSAEIETQFYLDGQARNLQVSDQQRLNSLIWNTLKDIPGAKLSAYPAAPYFQPNVSRRSDGGSGQ
jgi:hypothetical protein